MQLQEPVGEELTREKEVSEVRSREASARLAGAIRVERGTVPREARVRERHDEGAHRVADGEADVAEQCAVELVHALLAVRVARD